MYASKLGLADYISGRTNQNQCRVASFPLYKKGDKVHFFIFIYYLFCKHEDEIGGECLFSSKNDKIVNTFAGLGIQ